jgi:hypothetical protein
MAEWRRKPLKSWNLGLKMTPMIAAGQQSLKVSRTGA